MKYGMAVVIALVAVFAVMPSGARAGLWVDCATNASAAPAGWVNDGTFNHEYEATAAGVTVTVNQGATYGSAYTGGITYDKLNSLTSPATSIGTVCKDWLYSGPIVTVSNLKAGTYDVLLLGMDSSANTYSFSVNDGPTITTTSVGDNDPGTADEILDSISASDTITIPDQGQIVIKNTSSWMDSLDGFIIERQVGGGGPIPEPAGLGLLGLALLGLRRRRV